MLATEAIGVCGRFTLEKPIDAIQIRFGLDEAEPLAHVPRYNVAPGQPILTIVEEGGRRRPVYMRWGLVPSWQKEPKAGPINARAETVAERPMFRAAYRQRRCLIPADGFYEWQPRPGGGPGSSSATGRSTRTAPKQPFRFTRTDGGLFAFAGIWEWWEPPPQRADRRGQLSLFADDPDLEPDDAGGGSAAPARLLTCCLLTTTPNELVAPVHDRMPLMLPEDAEAAWLRGEPVPPLPYPAEEMTAYPVSTRVNSPRNDDAGCIAPLPAY